MERESSETHDAGEAWEVPCPRCRYDTRGLASERCPECGLTTFEAGRLLKQQQELATPGLRLLALAICTGGGLFCAAAATIIALGARGSGFYDSFDFLISAVRIAVCGGQIAACLINWRRFFARRPLIDLAWAMGLLFILLLMAPA